MRSPFWPFTRVLEKIGREVTREMRQDRRVALQGVLGHGRSRANAARARLVRANAQSQSDNLDSERAEIASGSTRRSPAYEAPAKSWRVDRSVHGKACRC
jgi:hypothetical protein